MPIDASIIGGLKPPAPIDIQDPLTAYAKGLQLKSLMGAQQLQGVQLQQAQQGLEDTNAAREAYRASVNADTGAVDRGALLKNLALKGAPDAFQKAQKSFLDADKAQADISKAKSETITHKLTAYKSLLGTANTPQDLAALFTAQYKDPDLGPMLQNMGSLESHLAKIPQDPAAFSQFKLMAEKGMDGVIQRQQEAKRLELTERGQNLTYGSSMYGHGITLRGQDMKADEEARKLDPLRIDPNTPAIGASRPVASFAPVGGLPPTPGGMPVNPSGGFRGDRNAPELPAMRRAMAEPLAPTGVDNADLLAAEMGLRNAKTPAARLGFQQAIESIKADMSAQGPQGGQGDAGMVMPASMPMAASGAVSGALGQPATDAAPAARGPIDMKLTGEEFLKQFPPAVQSQVRLLSEGKLQTTPRFFQSPQGAQLMGIAAQYEPGFDQTTYLSRAATAKDAASGTMAKTNNALNTLAGHLAGLADSADKLKNTDFPWVNKVKNLFKSSVMGDPEVNTFNLNLHGVTEEFERAYRGAGGSEGSIKQWRETLGDASSPQQFKDALAKGAEMLESKLKANQTQYEQGMRGKPGSYRSVTPETEKAFEKLRGKSTGNNSDLHAQAQAIINGNR